MSRNLTTLKDFSWKKRKIMSYWKNNIDAMVRLYYKYDTWDHSSMKKEYISDFESDQKQPKRNRKKIISPR